MGKTYDLEDRIELLKEQLPAVTKAFGVLREEATKDGILSVKTKRLMMVVVSVA